jgi:hypothetical protein
MVCVGESHVQRQPAMKTLRCLSFVLIAYRDQVLRNNKT